MHCWYPPCYLPGDQSLSVVHQVKHRDHRCEGHRSQSSSTCAHLNHSRLNARVHQRSRIRVDVLEQEVGRLDISIDDVLPVAL